MQLVQGSLKMDAAMPTSMYIPRKQSAESVAGEQPTTGTSSCKVSILTYEPRLKINGNVEMFGDVLLAHHHMPSLSASQLKVLGGI